MSNKEDAARRVVDEYFANVQTAKREEESKRDQALLLIVGGAFTISFPFVSSLREHGELVCVGYLKFAWFAWAVALVAALVSYECSIRGHEHVMNRLSAQQYDPAGFESVWSRALAIVNPLAMAATVVGFLAFAGFALPNVTTVPTPTEPAKPTSLCLFCTLGVSDGDQKEGSEEKGHAAAGPAECVRAAQPPTRLAVPHKSKKQKGCAMSGDQLERGSSIPMPPANWSDATKPAKAPEPTSTQPPQPGTQPPSPTPPQAGGSGS